MHNISIYSTVLSKNGASELFEFYLGSVILRVSLWFNEIMVNTLLFITFILMDFGSMKHLFVNTFPNLNLNFFLIIYTLNLQYL